MSLHVGSHGAQVTSLQKDLLRLHLLNQHSANGKFDTATRDAVKRYERGHHLAVDGFVPAWEAVSIHKAAAHANSSVHPGAAPPPSNYHHVKYQGVTVNQRTLSMIHTAEAYMHRLGVPGRLELSQGSFHHGKKSGTTHDGGGAIDVRVGNYSAHQRHLVAKAMRMAGFAAWNRYPSEGFDSHIHAIAIGDKTMSGGARAQVHAYFRGRNGLKNNGLDEDRSIGRPFPRWAAKYA